MSLKNKYAVITGCNKGIGKETVRIFSKNGSKIFVETYNKLKNKHNENFHDAPSLKKAYLTDMIQELIDDNIKISPIIISGKWCEIDTIEDLKKAELLFY